MGKANVIRRQMHSLAVCSWCGGAGRFLGHFESRSGRFPALSERAELPGQQRTGGDGIERKGPGGPEGSVAQEEGHG